MTHTARAAIALASLALHLGGTPALAQSAPPPPADTVTSTVPLFTRHDALILGGFAAATAAAVPLDLQVAQRLQYRQTQENRFFRRTAQVSTRLVEPGAAVAAAVLYGVGRLGGNERMATLGVRAGEAVFLALGSTVVIKGLAGRARPYVSNDSNPRDFRLGRGFFKEQFRSFPSGHTTTAFAVAAAMTAQADAWCDDCVWYVGPVMYGGAALAGLARMYDNKHWASDVIVGAAIGAFSGRKVVRYHETHGITRVDRWLLSGSVQVGASGVSAARVLILPY
jgi:hypothetical protein